MITVLLLTAAEKLINFAILSDQITKAGLAPLAGKVLRLSIAMPTFDVDIHFHDDHIRFEPVTDIEHSVFETPGNAEDERTQAWQDYAAIGSLKPDCTISVDNIAELLNLMRDASGNLPIDGDYKVLMQVKQLIAGFNPDIAGQLEPIIGSSLAMQLNLLIKFLKGNVSHTAKHAFNDVADWANDVAGNAPADPVEAAQVTDLKQQLLKLRADIEREEARLAMIKAEQARLKGER
ncbi:SCP2 domain-containing protein [Psychrobacter sp. FDAARGOS_221]|uniref:ubiquinone biosynthesis accessory factor UbiJ n=1 Tax=Psychrobacter sp. FDAARGOS_221 TaxID=1975705 RepID=UPI000BB57956|nr:hypothetical protein [Psychrobacter sp. FDAARGOS_221]PNK61555.1 hypothetical protein A6J60_012220 [Psychrobacter sp. FDAARGOS_221]